MVTAIGGATTLTVNVLLAKYWNKETLVRTDLYGVVCVIAGAVTIAINTGKSKSPGTIQGIYCSFLTSSFITYGVILVLVLILVLATVGGSYFNKARIQRTVPS